MKKYLPLDLSRLSHQPLLRLWLRSRLRLVFQLRLCFL
jgi:hypothetical protein